MEIGPGGAGEEAEEVEPWPHYRVATAASGEEESDKSERKSGPTAQLSASEERRGAEGEWTTAGFGGRDLVGRGGEGI